MEWLVWLLSLTVLGLLVAAGCLEHGIFPGGHRKPTVAGRWPTPKPMPIKNPEPVIELPGKEKGTGPGSAASARKSAHAVAEPEPIVYAGDCTTISGSIPNPMFRPAIGLDQGEAERWYPALQRGIKPYGIKANGDVLGIDERTGKEVVCLNGDGTHERVYHTT